jgi:hypothetical protein
LSTDAAGWSACSTARQGRSEQEFRAVLQQMLDVQG